MQFYITDSFNQTVALPVNPKEVSLDYTRDDSTVKVIKLGEISIIGDEKLVAVELQFILPVETDGVHYLSADNVWDTAAQYLERLNLLYTTRKNIRLVISDTDINFKGIISEFKYGMSDGYADEYQVTLKISQYKAHKAIKVKTTKKKTTAKKGKQRSAPPKKIGRGSKVVVNGVLHRNSAGSGPGATERNATRKISLIAKGAKYPYHVTTLSGGARGWVKASAVKAV